ncbi:dienelactone hydrolase family protein [Sporosarcina sp. GW1-11]|uniref:dienelactone hydrolase family protein n=1 Tax=Sporosarcina sp. GW1-11 TaxID=2899126 RepID=UPI00294BFDA8|nr:dienelactone hydrolase family protein [Sporosarcina sp. GW1-11]MDV6377465.1 dienelactone hydrolase family protein [Sporosarcina sp. GW1-11]
MLTIQNGSDRLLIVIHEIYGINQHITDICNELATKGFDILCPNLLEQEISFDYSEEKKAYHHFIEKIGFTKGVNHIKKILWDNQKNYSKIYIVGFSVGATIAWLCSEELSVDGVVCYYGSRIRDYTELEPVCPVLLICPTSEKSFSVVDLVATLKEESISIRVYDAHHGFSDPYSSVYNEVLAGAAHNTTLKFLLKS